MVFAISRLASIFRKVMKAGLFDIASPISCALFASPWIMAENKIVNQQCKCTGEFLPTRSKGGMKRHQTY